MLNLDSSVKEIDRIGEATAKRLKKLGINTVRDLIYYFPFRYDDYSKITDIADLGNGASANVVGEVEMIQNRRSHRRRMYITEAIINDGTDSLKVIWFNQPFIAKNIKPGDRISISGKVESEYGAAMMRSPVYEKIKAGGTIHTQGLVPNYHLTANLTQKQIRWAIDRAMPLGEKIVDWMPEDIKSGLCLLDQADALYKIHFPKDQKEVTDAHERLAFNELFLLQIESQLARMQNEANRSKPIVFKEKETVRFVKSLPFTLTNTQRRSAWEIIKDMEKNKPMMRLLEGDVGSGKTLVAVIAMLNVALNKKQSVLMVPTEILARQHYATICKLLSNDKIKIGLITRSDKKINYELRSKKYDKNKVNIHNTSFIIHNSDIVIGTHALIQDKIKFNDLALAIIDEQHRFGVDQRKKLISKAGGGLIPHLLSMTATPIPRSLALAIYGDLDISIIDEVPKNRKRIVTRLVTEDKRMKAYAFIREQVKSGRQVFVVCPLIDISDKLGVKSVEEEYKKLEKIIFPDLVIGRLHGRMKGEEKEKVMQAFVDNKINILLSTSVIEVGVDIPNASIMMIEGADRFGLAQIHQFRGRVGRSEHQSYCILFTDSESARSRQRLESLTKIDNGFELAKIDLKFRGPGEIYGLAQSGFPELKIASLFDYLLMKKARDEALKIISIDPSLKTWPKLKIMANERSIFSHRE